MFSVIFEVRPRPEKWDDYLGNAERLRPELEKVDGFIENIRYKSLLRDGWILSLSGWRDEKSVVRWRTSLHHHEAQEKGRGEILADYRLRVGQVTEDTQVPGGYRMNSVSTKPTSARPRRSRSSRRSDRRSFSKRRIRRTAPNSSDSIPMPTAS